jgi:integrase
MSAFQGGLEVVASDWRLFFRFLAVTGLRWGEAAALRWSDLMLEGSAPSVRVRRALGRRGKDAGPVFKPPKSRHGVREVPLDAGVAFELRRVGVRARLPTMPWYSQP